MSTYTFTGNDAKQVLDILSKEQGKFENSFKLDNVIDNYQLKSNNGVKITIEIKN